MTPYHQWPGCCPKSADYGALNFSMEHFLWALLLKEIGAPESADDKIIRIAEGARFTTLAGPKALPSTGATGFDLGAVTVPSFCFRFWPRFELDRIFLGWVTFRRTHPLATPIDLFLPK